jgi:hypothetical protein
MDASYGLVCKGDGKGQFVPLPVAETGIISSGDVRDLAWLQTKAGLVIVSAKNNSKLSVTKLNR